MLLSGTIIVAETSWFHIVCLLKNINRSRTLNKFHILRGFVFKRRRQQKMLGKLLFAQNQMKRPRSSNVFENVAADMRARSAEEGKQTIHMPCH